MGAHFKLDKLGKTAAAVVIALLCGLIANDLWVRHETRASSATYLVIAPTSTALTSTTLTLAARTYKTGDCVIWDQSTAPTSQRPTSVVPCSQPHLLEFVGTATISDSSPTYPSLAELEATTTQLCQPKVEQFLGEQLDPNGRFASSALQPTAASWLNGDRTLQCGIVITNSTAGANTTLDLPFAFEAKGADQHPPTPKGTCYKTDANGNTLGTVDCSTPHEIEVTGTVNIAGRATSDPNNTQLQTLVQSQCDALTRAFLGKPPTGNITSEWFPISQGSWDTGDRNVDCDVAKTDGSAYVAFSGSLAR